MICSYCYCWVGRSSLFSLSHPMPPPHLHCNRTLSWRKEGGNPKRWRRGRKGSWGQRHTREEGYLLTLPTIFLDYWLFSVSTVIAVKTKVLLFESCYLLLCMCGYEKEVVMGFEREVPCEIAEEAIPCIKSDVRGVPTFGQRSKDTKAVSGPRSYQLINQ